MALTLAAKRAIPYLPDFSNWGEVREEAIALVVEQGARNGEYLTRDRARLHALRFLCELIADEEGDDPSAARVLEDRLLEDARLLLCLPV